MGGVGTGGGGTGGGVDHVKLILNFARSIEVRVLFFVYRYHVTRASSSYKDNTT